MKSIRVYIDGKVMLYADLQSETESGDLIRQIARVVDRHTITRQIRECMETKIVDLWNAFLDAMAAEHFTTSAAILSRNRSRPFPQLRAIIAAAWIETTNEFKIKVAGRLGLDHSTLIHNINKLNGQGRVDKELRAQHQRAIEICRSLFSVKETEV